MLIFILNILWFVLGGFFAGLGWVLAGVLMAITIIGIPWARSCFMLARYTFWPFGYDIVSREQLYGEHDIGTGALGTIGNIIWFVLAGWWLALMHISAAAALARSKSRPCDALPIGDLAGARPQKRPSAASSPTGT